MLLKYLIINRVSTLELVIFYLIQLVIFHLIQLVIFHFIQLVIIHLIQLVIFNLTRLVGEPKHIASEVGDFLLPMQLHILLIPHQPHRPASLYKCASYLASVSSFLLL